MNESFELKMRELSPEDGHYFFGYYDLQPYHPNGRFHLAHKVQFVDRLPEADDVAELGYIDTETRTFHKIAETTAWNFQQGAMLQWYGEDHILYNVRKGDHFETAITNWKTGETRYCPLPSAHVSADGRYSLSINFSRIFDFRPGYGYAGKPDPFAEVKHPAEDGIFLQNLQTGEYKLIVSYERMAKEFPQAPYTDEKIVVNHITFNPSAKRFLFLLRNFPGAVGRHRTMLLTSDLEGNLYKLTDYEVNSHYHWKNDEEILMVYGTGVVGFYPFKHALFRMEDQTPHKMWIPEKQLIGDVHCLYSPDRRYISGDGYPGREDRKRKLYLYDTQTEQCIVLAAIPVTDPPLTDLRCDLHARWNPAGDKLSLDSNATGRRTVMEIDLTNVIN